MNGMWCSHALEYYSGMKRNEVTSTRHCTEEPHLHYAKRNKPVIEAHRLYEAID